MGGGIVFSAREIESAVGLLHRYCPEVASWLDHQMLSDLLAAVCSAPPDFEGGAEHISSREFEPLPAVAFTGPLAFDDVLAALSAASADEGERIEELLMMHYGAMNATARAEWERKLKLFRDLLKD